MKLTDAKLKLEQTIGKFPTVNDSSNRMWEGKERRERDALLHLW